MKIGVKFCGGCHVSYDRMEAFSRIKDELTEKAEFVSHEDKDADLVLVVMGCPSACVETDIYDQSRLRIVKSRDEAETFIKEVKGF